ncbi:murein hydrolase activator EnvC family protein [Shinella zoogloeoides]|uniref:Peptidoglycan DD-metalloendopeptidase family protein n=1 Tax=Shinella zoogloeoides TaxID=352475 RepID=A0A6N8TC04_SHIZO|nr:murein hydrolase activator EnvC [Shinella zoogloeoides]MXO00812.1 peptidoglycan DD-metalloendopeptidase family protein [Shinella zoogloeoides]
MRKTGTANSGKGVSRLLRPALLSAVLLPALICQPLRAEPQGAAAALEKTGALPKAEPDPAAALALRRDSTRRELETLSQSITVSDEKTKQLEAEIATLEKSRQTLREEIVKSAALRKEMEGKILDGEKRLEGMREEEAGVRASLHERRGLLAEVLAALQRMGRNPPPALLVTPDDALASVRSAILLGAVVPGIRKETDALIDDLSALMDIKSDIDREKTELTDAMQVRIEAEKRVELLVAENEALTQTNSRTLAAERRRAEELAARATSLEGLIGSLEQEIGSVRDAAALARSKEEERRNQSDAEREKARALARETMPDKNRIAPAYEFPELQAKLDFPVAGDVLRQFGEADGTGHDSQGLTLAANPGALVTAPADGWIVFAGTFRSYGRMIILNAGEGYHLVLAGMDKVNVREGQFVVAGEPLATMGEKRVASVNALTLETDKPTLYIEFRKNGKPVDSRPWWSAKNPGKARNDS